NSACQALGRWPLRILRALARGMRLALFRRPHRCRNVILIVERHEVRVAAACYSLVVQGKLRADKTLSRPGYISQDRFFEQFHVSSSSPQTYLVCAQPLSLGILLFSGVPFYAVATTPAGIWAPSDDDTSERELCSACRASSSVRSSL